MTMIWAKYMDKGSSWEVVPCSVPVLAVDEKRLVVNLREPILTEMIRYQFLQADLWACSLKLEMHGRVYGDWFLFGRDGFVNVSPPVLIGPESKFFIILDATGPVCVNLALDGQHIRKL